LRQAQLRLRAGEKVKKIKRFADCSHRGACFPAGSRPVPVHFC
jgi:hypothetical protein